MLSRKIQLRGQLEKIGFISRLGPYLIRQGNTDFNHFVFFFLHLIFTQTQRSPLMKIVPIIYISLNYLFNISNFTI